jgi:hypothetical protein
LCKFLGIIGRKEAKAHPGWRADDDDDDDIDYDYWTKFDMGMEIVRDLDAKIVDSCLIFC